MCYVQGLVFLRLGVNYFTFRGLLSVTLGG